MRQHGWYMGEQHPDFLRYDRATDELYVPPLYNNLYLDMYNQKQANQLMIQMQGIWLISATGPGRARNTKILSPSQRTPPLSRHLGSGEKNMTTITDLSLPLPFHPPKSESEAKTRKPDPKPRPPIRF